MLGAWLFRTGGVPHCPVASGREGRCRSGALAQQGSQLFVYPRVYREQLLLLLLTKECTNVLIERVGQ